jgi:hypothetical protein
MKKYTFQIALAILLILGLNSCQESSSSTSQDIKRVSIENASSLMITSDGANNNKLLKTTASNDVEEVQYFNENEEPLESSPVPSNIFEVNDDYVILCFDYDNIAHLVRKFDGATFDLTPLGVPHYIINNGQWEGPRNRKRVQTDAAGNIYYIKGSEDPLVKVDITNLYALTGSVLTLPDDQVHDFIVNPDGNVAYKSWGTNSGDRIKKANGGIYTLPDNNFWLNLMGNINYSTYLTGPSNYVVDLSINSSSGVVSADTTITSEQIFMSSGGTYEFTFSDKIVAIYNQIIELDNITNTPTTINYTLTGNLEHADASSDHIFLLTKNGGNRILSKLNKDTYFSQDLLSTNADGYDIYDFSVNENNVITFYAIRLVDGLKVLGEINAAGTVTILSSSISNPVIQLQRIN